MRKRRGKEEETGKRNGASGKILNVTNEK